MNKELFNRLPEELKVELNKVTFFPKTEAETELKLQGSKNIKKTIVKMMVEDETNRRVELLVKALKKLEELGKEYEKIKPDSGGGYDANGVKLPLTYSTSLGEKRISLKKQIKDLVEAINLATSEDSEKFTFENLDKAMK